MKALIITDVQNDFCPGGALPVLEGDGIVPLINQLQSRFDLVAAVQDWHPADHGSFAANHPGKTVGEVIDLNGLPQILWPVHCVENTAGADFHPGLDRRRIARVFHKGTDPDIDSYSGFFDNRRRKATGLGEYLKQRGIEEVYLCGLATDYCVKFSALDAVDLGFKTCVIQDACRGVNLAPKDVCRAIEEMKSKGVAVCISDEVLKRGIK
ncbi:MAG: bifunctional nicotinamidase/pyrazinamidase [Thermoguttaceae bacterium]|jgi:nicotinamidase/pyrazinamidase